jgi:hypothetical protein
MPGEVAQSIFDAFVRTGRVPHERAQPWPDELALLGDTYGGDLEEWITTAVCQDWVPMPDDVQRRLGDAVTYSQGSSVLRRRGAGFDTP